MRLGRVKLNIPQNASIAGLVSTNQLMIILSWYNTITIIHQLSIYTSMKHLFYLEIIYNRRRSTKQARLGFEIDSILIKREA